MKRSTVPSRAPLIAVLTHGRTTALSGRPLPHICITVDFARNFATDIEAVASDGDSNDDDDPEPCSGCSSGPPTREGSPHPVLPTLNPVVSEGSSLDLCSFIDLKAIKTTSSAASVHAQAVGQPLQRTNTLPSFQANFLPEQLDWETEWVPPVVPPSTPIVAPCETIAELTENSYQAAVQGQRSSTFSLVAPDVNGLMVLYKKRIQFALHRNNFTDILSPDQHFAV